MYVHMYICVCVYIYIYICVCTRLQIHKTLVYIKYIMGLVQNNNEMGEHTNNIYTNNPPVKTKSLNGYESITQTT